MGARFASTYVDQLFSEKDFDGIYQVISVVGMQHPLPEEFWLFCRIYERAPARSGVWQYYEGLPERIFIRATKALETFGLSNIAEKYKQGKSTRYNPEQAADLDRWLDSHAGEIYEACFALIAARKNFLTNCD